MSFIVRIFRLRKLRYAFFIGSEYLKATSEAPVVLIRAHIVLSMRENENAIFFLWGHVPLVSRSVSYAPVIGPR